MFAEVAAVGGIGEIGGVIELVCMNDADGQIEVLRDLQSFLEFTAGQAGRISNSGERTRAKLLVRNEREKNRIDATGVGDYARTIRAKQCPELI